MLLTVAKWQLKSKPHHPYTNTLGQEMFLSFFLLHLNNVLTCSLHPSFTDYFKLITFFILTSIKAHGFPWYIPPPLHLVNTHSTSSQCKSYGSGSVFHAALASKSTPSWQYYSYSHLISICLFYNKETWFLVWFYHCILSIKPVSGQVGT